MMKKPGKQTENLPKVMNFPRKGEIINGKQILDSKMTVQADIVSYTITFPKGTKVKEIPTLLRKFFATQVIPDGRIVGHHDYSVKPVNGNPTVDGQMQLSNVVRTNPTVQEFDEEYSQMEMSNPETYFRKFAYRGFNSPQFRQQLFDFVGYMGENYGYCDDKNIYHRRASLVMPKIKITKAIPQAKMMYHTHPSKDEPSLSSADDYLLYMDLSHAPRSIRHFFTVMKDRMDHFQISPKKKAKADYLRLDEAKMLEEIDAQISELEEKWNAKTPPRDNMPKEVKKDADLQYCENITRDLVKWMGTKYGRYFSFKYKCYYRVRKNPEGPTANDLHLKDEFLSKAVADINSKKYSWPEFRTSELPHEKYAYWHQMYYTQHVKDSYMTIGVTPQGADKRRYSQYMTAPFQESEFSNLDALNILNISYDISASDKKIRDGGGTESRLAELCEYLSVPDEAKETLLLLEDVIRNKDVYGEEAIMLSGDYYPLVILSNYSIRAIEAIQEVEAGRKDIEMAKYEIYNQLKAKAGDAVIAFLAREVRLEGKGFVDSYLNPRGITVGKVEFYSDIPKEALELYDIVEEAWIEFSASKYSDKSPFLTGRGKFNLRVPTENGLVTVMVSQSTGKAQIFVPNLETAMEDAMKAMDTLGASLFKVGLPIDPDEFNVKSVDPAINPQKNMIIALCGPSGSGKSTTMRNLLKMLPEAYTAPTYTTRQKRASDKPGEKVFVTKSEFEKLMQSGEMVLARLQKNGNYYGRKLSDMDKGQYIIVDVNLSGLNDLRRTFPNSYAVYLEPVEDPEFIRKRLLRRGDMSPQEASKRAQIIPSHIESSKAMDFDLRVKTQQGKFDYISKEIMANLPKKNPSLDDFGLTLEELEEVAEEENEQAEEIAKALTSPKTTQAKLPPELTAGAQVAPLKILKGVKPNPVRRADPVGLERFTKWVRLVNMKNKELKAFLDSDLGKIAGINKERQKEFGGINRGRTSGLAILRMRGKLGLTGPKDYIKDGPMIIKRYYNMALEKWNETDWYWCGRQISFNSRARGQRGPYTDKKGRPTRKLLALWVWGHDPWRYARKVEKREKMPPCPNVPWIGMTEKNKWGRTEFTYKNPPTIIGTGSPKKVAEYKALLGDGYTYDDQYDLPEVVGDPKTVIIEKAALAYRVWGEPVIVEDTTLHIQGMTLEDASNIKWMVDDLPDHVGKTAVERVAIAYADGKKVYAYMGRTDGKLVTRRGTSGFAHDFYFMPDGSSKTYAEEKKVSSRTKAIKKLVADKPDFVVDMPSEWTGRWQENYTPEDMLAQLEEAPLPNPSVLSQLREFYQKADKDLKILERGDLLVDRLGIYGQTVDRAPQTGQSLQKELQDKANMNRDEFSKRPASTGTFLTLMKTIGDEDLLVAQQVLVESHLPEVLIHEDLMRLYEVTDLQGPRKVIREMLNVIEQYRFQKYESGYDKDYLTMYVRELLHSSPDSAAARNLNNIVEGSHMLTMQATTDHEFVHKADRFDYLNQMQSSEQQKRLKENAAQMLEGAYPYAAIVDFYWLENPEDKFYKRGSLGVSLMKYVNIGSLPEDEYYYLRSLRLDLFPYKTPEEMKALFDHNLGILVNPKTPEGRKFPKKYLKGLNSLEKAIAMKEIDKGYKYDMDDPKAYEFWVSDIKATARGYKTVPSKYQKKFVQMYGPLPEEGDFLTKVSKATGIKKDILKQVHDKGLAAWRIGHRPGVQPHQWASGRVYAFVTKAKSSTAPGKPDHKLAVEAGLYPKSNPSTDVTNGTLVSKFAVQENPDLSAKVLISSIQKKNYLGRGANGSVFAIPNTNYVFKIDRATNTAYYKDLINWLDNNEPKPKYPDNLREVYRFDWPIKSDIGLPLYAVGGPLNKKAQYNTVMSRISGYTIANIYTKDRKPLSPKAVYTNLKKHRDAVDSLPQSAWDKLLLGHIEASKHGIGSDIHSGNMIMDPEAKRVYCFDYFYEFDVEQFVGAKIDLFEEVLPINAYTRLRHAVDQSFRKKLPKGKKPPFTKKQAEEVTLFLIDSIRSIDKSLEKFYKTVNKLNVEVKGWSYLTGTGRFNDSRSYMEIIEDAIIPSVKTLRKMNLLSPENSDDKYFDELRELPLLDNPNEWRHGDFAEEDPFEEYFG